MTMVMDGCGTRGCGGNMKTVMIKGCLVRARGGYGSSRSRTTVENPNVSDIFL